MLSSILASVVLVLEVSASTEVTLPAQPTPLHATLLMPAGAAGVVAVLLKIAPVDRAGNLAGYRDPGLPLAPGVVEAVAEFITAH